MERKKRRDAVKPGTPPEAASTSVLAGLAELQRLELPELRERWKELFGTEPPAYRRDRMVRRLAYRLQELAHGGLADWAKERLEEIAGEADGSAKKSGNVQSMRRRNQDGRLSPGCKLVREYAGQTHEVLVLDSGFEYQGRKYGSLSAVARTIAGGTQWNGWQFFGLKGKRRAP